MCRIVGYVGQAIALDRLLYKPEHSLVRQSYAPQEMTAGILNADGFGVGWYGCGDGVQFAPVSGAPGSAAQPASATTPFVYRSIVPIWNDANLPDLSRYVTSEVVLASVRSATPGLPVDLSNCPPFRHEGTLMVHNGAIQDFRQTLLTPLRDRLSPEFARLITGCTDSEHLFALILDLWRNTGSLEEALAEAISTLLFLADEHRVEVSANVILSSGHRLVACRAGNKSPQPSLYWLQDDSEGSDGVAIASEPLWSGKWQPFPEQTLLTVENDLSVKLQSL
ncbi:MAG: class II glutamine amidotransferase [Elainellaceae cyanobacterium]